jgi:hypothetical protein
LPGRRETFSLKGRGLKQQRLNEGRVLESACAVLGLPIEKESIGLRIAFDPFNWI